jgi:heat shock protein HtpX
MAHIYNKLMHQLKNLTHMLVLFLFMGIVLSLLGYVLAGIKGVLWAAVLGGLLVIISPNLTPSFILSLYGGKLLLASDVPDLHKITQELAVRADLVSYPLLYYIPSHMLNAFSVGSPKNSAIGLSDGLLNSLSLRELIGVLAHEISHIKHNDAQVMGYAYIIGHITSTLSLTGILLILFNLPLFFMGLVTISWLAIGILIVAPNIITFLQLLLSRMKEFDADREAIILTGDPEGLAMALSKLEDYESLDKQVLFHSGHRSSLPSNIRTHPDTKERIERLLHLKAPLDQYLKNLNHDSFVIPINFRKKLRPPHWHLNGLWY